MSEFVAVRTLADLNQLDEKEMVAGYLAGIENAPEPGSDKSRSFWHGWRNGRSDRGYAPIDSAQSELAMRIVGKYKGLQ